MGTLPTVKIKTHFGRGWAIINESDFDPAMHERCDGAKSDKEFLAPQLSSAPVVSVDAAFVGDKPAEISPIQVTQEPANEPAIAPDVAIPSDWESLHWKKRVKLAEDLTGQDFKKADDADAAIRAILDMEA